LSSVCVGKQEFVFQVILYEHIVVQEKCVVNSQISLNLLETW